MNGKTDVLLEDDLAIESDFNDAIDSLRKSLSEESGSLIKSKKITKKFDGDEGDEEPEEDEGDEEEEEEVEKSRKTIEDTLMEDNEAAAAMDVEPFLLQLAKAIDEGNAQLDAKINKVATLVKSIGHATLAGAELQKSMKDMVAQIGNTAVPSGSYKRMDKARFAGEEKPVDTRLVLAKSRDWVREGKMNLLEAGNLEGRINKGLLGKVGDQLDVKVAQYIKEGVA